MATDRPARTKLDALIRSNRMSLGPYIRRIARASVAAAMLSGCGMSHSGPEDGGMDAFVPDSSMPDSSMPDSALPDSSMPDATVPSALCETDGTYLAVHGLAPAAPHTFLGALGGSDFGGPSSIIDGIGDQCGEARTTDCDTDVANLVASTYQRGLLTTDDGSVSMHLSQPQVATLLGAIDTPKEAALMAWHAGYDIYCVGDDVSAVTEIRGGYEVIAYQNSGGCGTPWITTRFTLFVSASGEITVQDSVVVAEEEGTGCIGRRPVGLHACVDDTPSVGVLGDYFANIARLEQSAVAAFDVMITELEQLGAPDSLLDRARQARADEVAHTTSMGGLALRFGATPLTAEVDEAPPRTPYEIALENAVEGCVRETFGALVGAHQALRARDPHIAAEMKIVADDEIRHAELSWAVAAWLEPQLTDGERAMIDQAKRDAVVMLRHQASETIDPALVTQAGVPEPATTIAMVDQLARDIWA